MIELRQLKDSDPLDRFVEKESDQQGYSPMDPPDAYAPPASETIPYDEMPKLLRQLIDEHKAYSDHLKAFEDILAHIQENGPTRGAQEGLTTFFRYLDEHMVVHHLKEEKVLFPVLEDRLREVGEHGAGPYKKTAIDVMEDDHTKTVQLAAVTFNLLGLVSRLPDPASRAVVLDAALAQGRSLVELARLHIFREDTVVFPLATKHITSDEFAAMASKAETLASY